MGAQSSPLFSTPCSHPLTCHTPGGEVYTGPNFNAGLQAGQRQAAANTAEMGAAPTGEVKRASPMVPSATKQTGQPGSLFKGLAQGAAESLKAASSETAAAQVGAMGGWYPSRHMCAML
jgi:hypothetical protein